MLSRPFRGHFLLTKHPQFGILCGANLGGANLDDSHHTERTFHLETVYGYHDENKEKRLFNALENGYLGTVKFLVGIGTVMNDTRERDMKTIYDYTFILAAAHGHLEVVKYLIGVGADVHADDDSALRCASGRGYLDMIKYLVGIGANIHARGGQALKWASSRNRLDVIKYLIGVGADIHATNDDAFFAAINRTIDCLYPPMDSHLDMVKFLVGNGANIHARGDQILQFYLQKNHSDVVEYLVEQGANIRSLS
jgi:ankyrin repeat protein